MEHQRRRPLGEGSRYSHEHAPQRRSRASSGLDSGAAYRPLREDDLRLYRRPWLGPDGQAAFYRQLAQMSDRYTDEIEDHYDSIDCPVTVLWGEQDRWIPLDRGRELARRIPGATLRPVPEAGHLLQEDAPEAVVATVLDVLAAA
ncbi:alpha/beta fold hydrolase [Nocardia pseudobrasiliensis]|uniref:Alpha/beta hydrolase family protein n=1 Tax=Nocardia pseudobrasiliensis TaxID=45979 RepID=A0A370I7B3_9NOCA|nr:alpha/beta fold hydrolase [Nocardia pseudobrasiliensis]RDI65224.1 alpha/beta hydrolase family protein [Nocardia pseudobrasiliensis]